MNRRTLLASLGCAAFAGCSGFGDGESDGGPPTVADASGATGEQGASNGVNVVEHRLVEYEQFGQETVAVRGVLHNGTGRWLSYLEARATFLDDSNVVGDGFSSIAHVRPDRSWRFNVAFHSGSGEPSSAVADYEFDGSYDVGSGDPTPAGVAVADVEMTDEEQFGEPTKVVEGTIENVGNRDLEYVEAAVHFLDADAVVVGENVSNTTELRAGDDWDFEVDYFSPSRTHVSEAVGYDLVVTA